MNIEFWMEDEERSTALAIGAVPRSIDNVPECPLMPGDLISFPEAPEIPYRVIDRYYRASTTGPGQWLIQLAAARPLPRASA